jgi:hypothetical protein
MFKRGRGSETFSRILPSHRLLGMKTKTQKRLRAWWTIVQPFLLAAFTQLVAWALS